MAILDSNVPFNVSLTCFVIGVMLWLWVIDYVIEDRHRRRSKALLRRMDENFKRIKEQSRHGRSC